MTTTTHSSYTLSFSGGGGAEYLWGFAFQSSDLTTVYHYTDFSEKATIVKVNPLGETTPVTSIVVVSSFTVSYNTVTYKSWTSSQSIWVTGNSTAGSASLTFGGQHQGVFQRQQWHVRNTEWDFDRTHDNGTDTEYNGVDEFRGKYDVDGRFITVKKSRDEIRQALPKGYYAGFRFVPDRTTMTSITFTVRCSVGGQSVTFTATQTVRNSWDKQLKEIRDFVYEGKGEQNTTTYNQGGDLTKLTISSLVVNNTSSLGSSATITVNTVGLQSVVTGNVVYVTVTSTGTNHKLAQGRFNVTSINSTSSFTFTVTSQGTISTTTSLLASIQYLKTVPTLTLFKF